jgi:lysophospholipase L1-like esterase
MKRVIPIPLFVLLMFQALLCIGGCTKQRGSNTYTMPNPNTNPAPLPPASTDTGKRYLALGDSYTIGQNVHEYARFPTQTVGLLRQQGIAIRDPEYIAVTGWTTSNLKAAIATRMPQGPYDVVTLLIGVNDQYQHMDTGGYRIRFTELLNKSVELAGNRASRVFVLSIPDYSATPFVPQADKARVSKAIDWFNAINKEITLRSNIAYIDITPSTREAKDNPALVAEDGLHPSGVAYKIWADMLAPLVKKALQ